MTNNESLNDTFLKHYDIEAREIKIDEWLIAKLIKENSGKPFHLKKYVKATFFGSRLIEVIADFSNQCFFDQNFSNIDFSGCILTGAQFSNCNFHKSVLKNLDLTNVQFIDCNLTDADLRGVYFANCTFQTNTPSGHYQGVKLSGTKEQLKQVIENDQQLLNKLAADHKRSLDDKILALKSKIQEIEQELTLTQKVLHQFAYKTGHAQYDEAIENLKLLAKTSTEKRKSPENLLSASLNELISAEAIFDKHYSCNQDFLSLDESQSDKTIIKIEKHEIADYLDFIKNNNPISLYEYLKKDDQKFIINLSDDYTATDFSDSNLHNISFVGSVLRNCIFTKANIEGSIFTGVDLEETIFDESKARNCNFTYANMENIFINNSDFNNSIFDYTNLVKANFLTSNLNFILARRALFKNTKIGKSNFNYADLSHSNFAESQIMNCTFFRSNLKNALFNQTKILNTCYNFSTLAYADFTESQIADCSFNFVYAPNVNFNATYCSSAITFDDAFLINAKLSNLHTDQLSCTNSIMHNTDLTDANIHVVTLNEASAININCQNSVFNTIKANFANLAKANLDGLSSHKSSWESSILIKSNITNAKITNGNFTYADLCSANCTKSNFKHGNFSHAKLNNTQLVETNLEEANLSNAEIDYTTEFNNANIENVEGYLKVTTRNNKPIYPIQFKENCEKLYEEKTKSLISTLDSLFFKQLHNVLNFLALFFRESHESTPYRIIFGLITGYAYSQVAMTYIDDKTSIDSLIILMGGSIASYLVGFTISNYIHKHIIGTNIITLLAGWYLGSYPGILYGFLLGISLNKIIKLYFSISLNEQLDLTIMKAANFAIEISDGVRSSKEAKEFYSMRMADKRILYKFDDINSDNANPTSPAINTAETNYARYLSLTEQEDIIFIDNGKINIELENEKSFDNTDVIEEKNNIEEIDN